MALKIGVLVGGERSFAAGLTGEVNRRGEEGVEAEYLELAAPGVRDPVGYGVIVDLASHEVPYYRSYLKHAVLQGATVVNNPFMCSADDGFFGASLATRLGIASPKTVLLPHGEQAPDWDAVIARVGLPCVLKDAASGGSRRALVCHSREELVRRHGEGGRRLMLVQEVVEGEQRVRCLCIGQEEALPMVYDPRERRYQAEGEPLRSGLDREVRDESLRLARALGYDVAAVDWTVRDGIPHVADSMNPAPELDAGSLGPQGFDWAVRKTADLTIGLAKEPRPQRRPLRWEDFLTGRRKDGTWGEPLTGQSDDDGAGDLAEELPSLAQRMPRSRLQQ